MSLSPFDSFQSRFVTYLLNFPRIKQLHLRSIIYSLFIYLFIYLFICGRKGDVLRQ